MLDQQIVEATRLGAFENGSDKPKKLRWASSWTSAKA